MAETPKDPTTLDARFEEVVADFLRVREEGRNPNPQRYLESFPELAPRLSHFFEDLSRFDRMAPDQAPTAAASLRPSGAAHSACIPGFELLEELGRGGMGVVYKARQTRLGRIVALKMIKAGALDAAAARERFRVEAEAIARLQHPHIVQVFEFGEHDGQPYCALEYCPSGSLADRLHGATLPPREAATLVETLARAMDAAHQAKVIHRDLKPGNILLQKNFSQSGEDAAEDQETDSLRPLAPLRECIPKIADFGLARKLDDVGRTGSGVALGTPSYMAPEQASGHPHAHGPGVDVYALGGILYECLTSRPPFVAATVMETLRQVIHDEPVAPRRLVPTTPRDLETICLKCLQKEPGRRYTSAAQLADDLERFRKNEPIVARPVGLAERAWRWGKRNPAPAALLGLIVALAVVGPVVALHQSFLTGLEAKARRAAEYATQNEADARRDAEGASDRAITARGQARDAERNARRFLYVSDVNRAFRAWEDGSLLEALDLLRRHETEEGQEELRGPEWYFLRRACERALATPTYRPAAGLSKSAVTPDGEYVITADGAGDLTAWNAAGEAVRTGRAGATVLALSVSPDNATLVAYLGDGRLSSINLADLTERRGNRLGGKVAHAAVFSEDASLLATYTVGDAEILLWDVAKGERKRVLKIGTRPTTLTRILSFDREGRQLAFTSGGTTTVWRLETGAERTTIKTGDAWWAFSTAFSPDGKKLYRAGGMPPQAIEIWDLETGRWVGDVHGHRGHINALAFSHDGRVLASAGDDRIIRLWSASDSQPLGQLRGHTGPVRQLAFAPGDRWLVSSASDGTARRWDRQTPTDSFKLELGRYPTDLAFLADGRQLVVSTYSKAPPAYTEMEVIDVTSGRIVALEKHIDATPLRPVSRLLAKDVLAKEMKLYDLATLRIVASLEGDAANLRKLQSLDGRRVVGYGPTGLCVWEVPSGRLLAKNSFPDAVGMIVAPDGSCMATNSKDGIRLWGADLASGAPLGFTPWRAEFAPDGALLLFTDKEVQIRSDHGTVLRGLLTKVPAPLAKNYFARSAYSADGRFLALSQGRDVWLWELATGKRLAVLKGHRAPLIGMAFDPDGRTLATGAHDGQVKLWSMSTYEELTSLQGEEDPFCLAFGPDGSLAIGSPNSTVQVWRTGK